MAYRGTSVSSRRCLLWLSASPMAVIIIRVRRVVIVLIIIIEITTIILILTDHNSSLGYFGQFPWRCCRSTQAAPRTYVLRSTWRFMGSYNWGYKSPNMGYTYKVTRLITLLITTNKPPSIHSTHRLHSSSCVGIT